MASYKLTYFSGRGRGEIARMLFALGDIPFEDHKIKYEDWDKLKPTTPWGYLPILEVDGEVIGESLAIARLVATQAGLYGKTAMEKARIDAIVYASTELFDGVIHTLFGPDDEAKEKGWQELSEQTVPRVLGKLEKVLDDNKSGLFVGDKLSLADVQVFNVLEHVTGLNDHLLDGFPLVRDHFERVKELPRIKKYLAQRPESPF